MKRSPRWNRWYPAPGTSRHKMTRPQRALRLRVRFEAGRMSHQRYVKCIHLLYPMEGLW